LKKSFYKFCLLKICREWETTFYATATAFTFTTKVLTKTGITKRN
jgi:hypothetical protein